MLSRNLKFTALWLGLAVLLVAAVFPALAEETKDPSQPIKNLQFQSAEIRSVLTFLADYGGVNVVIAPEVKGTVTIKLHEVMWKEAMDIVCRTYDLALVSEEGGYMRVLGNEAYRKETTEREKHNQEQRQLAGLETKIVKVSNSTSDDIEKAVKSLLTERGKATSDSRSNSIILQEVPTNMQSVLNYIAELDKPARQIKISAQLIEISSKGLQEIGIKWGLEGTYKSDNGNTITQKGEVLNQRNSDVAGRYTVSALAKGWSVNALVEAMVNDGKGKIIAHPEITTIDNKEAKIQMGQKVPIKQYDAAGNVTTTFENVGTILTVTPHITAENQILMHLMPERSTYSFDANGVIIATNNAETNVIVANGQTAVIGGLTTQDETESTTGVPVLKDIPILGLLFKYTNKKVENHDLVIFVTPSIVDENLAQKP
ncbi:MAG: type IV pilus secretin PilQ [Candidatus Zixiibacteriota bacterium]